MKHLPLQYSSRGIITDRDGRILLVKHAEHKPWTLPGGHLEENETFQEALIREAKEELSIAIELIGLVTLCQEPNITTLPAPVRVQVIEYENEKWFHKKYEEFFLAHIISGTIFPQASEIADYDWKTLEEIRTIPEDGIYISIRELILCVTV